MNPSVDPKPAALVISGIPGAGKSIVACIVDEILARWQEGIAE